MKSLHCLLKFASPEAHRSLPGGLLVKGVLAALAALIITSTATDVSQAAKPGPPATPPPPVKFQLVVAPAPVMTEDMSDQGELVGLYDLPGVNEAACLVVGNQITLLEEIVPAPEGWYYYKATGINNQGTIVGYMYRDDQPIDNTKKHAFVMHRPEGGSPFVLEVPDFHLSRPYPVDINEDGFLLGWTSTGGIIGGYVYDTLDPASPPTELPVAVTSVSGITSAVVPQVFGRDLFYKPFIYTLGEDQPDVLNFENIHALNDFGAFCGPVTQKNGKAIAYRYSSDGVYQTFPDSKGAATKINNSGDMTFGSTNAGSGQQLYSQGVGTLNLGNLLVGNAGDTSLFLNYPVRVQSLTERGTLNPAMANFPGIGGFIYGPNGGVPFTLTPVAP